MNRTPARNIWISCAVILAVACLCLGAIGLTGGGIAAWQSAQPEAQAVQPTRAPITPRPTLAPEPGAATPTPLPEDSTLALPPALALEMDVIQRQVEEIRGLAPLYPVPRFLLTREQLRQRLVDDLLADYTAEDARDESYSLAAFGLVEPGYNLRDLLLDLYTEQIAGFYDDEVKAMYVIQGASFGGAERQTYAHEYGHALQDMYFDLSNGVSLDEEFCESNSDPCSGVQALIEGDATLVGNTWLFDYATEQDRTELMETAQTYSSPVYDSAPYFLKESFIFPYTGGLEFVQSMYDRGGWNAVDDAFASPPASSEQVLHPDLYPSDAPQVVELPDLSSELGSGWRLVDDDVMGEYGLLLVLSASYQEKARLSESSARAAAAGWDGDRYQVWVREADGATLLVLRAVWDSQSDARQFNNALKKFGSQSGWFGQVSQQSQDAEHTLWLVAPDAETLGMLAQTLQP